MTFNKIVLLCSFVTLCSVFPLTAVSADLYQEIKQQVQADLSQSHPKAIIKIAFNSKNTHKSNKKCNNYDLSKLRKIPTGGRISLRLTCKHPKWSTYIGLKISILYPIANARTHITKGTQLTATNIIFKPTDITRSSQAYFSDPIFVLGQVAKKNIKRDQIITPNMLDQPTLILKGDSVIIQAGIGGLTISTLGTALQKGKRGRQIRIRNDKSGKIIKAYVIARGRVSTNPE